ncbi:MAG TPA: lysoplasmalogenase, partial [Jatrophihabitans sp.]|nr:lysoplasmalogenase [Jatrophihabitans sp.]
QRLFRVEHLLKPATMALLLAAAATADLGDLKPWVLGALAFGLIGDIGLMFSDGSTDLPFVLGLGAFLLGHIWYIVAFLHAGIHGIEAVAGALVAAGIAGLTLPAVLRGVARSAGRELAFVVATYAAVLAAMTVLGVGTAIIATALGAVIFLISDTLIARERFVAPMRQRSLLIIVTYHLAQFLIVIGLVHAA